MGVQKKIKKRIKKVIIAILIIAVAGAIGTFSVDYHVSRVGSKYILSPDKVPESDAIIVLGAYVYPNGRLSDMLKDRVDTGLEVYNKGKGKKLLLSGDHGQTTYDEVNSMKNYVKSKGIKAEDIFMDHAGFSTYETMYRARDVFKAKKVIIITQEYHLKRAVYLARSLGIDAYGVVADKQDYRGMATYKAREVLARCKAFLNINITKPKPTFLGEPIPITGDGRVTDDKDVYNKK